MRNVKKWIAFVLILAMMAAVVLEAQADGSPTGPSMPTGGGSSYIIIDDSSSTSTDTTTGTEGTTTETEGTTTGTEGTTTGTEGTTTGTEGTTTGTEGTTTGTEGTTTGTEGTTTGTEGTNPDYDSAGQQDVNTQDHEGGVIVTTQFSETENGKIDTKDVPVTQIESPEGENSVTIENARNEDNKLIPITKVGNGKDGVFATKDGQNITDVTIDSTKKVAMRKNAAKGSNVKTWNFESRVKLHKNAFKGTNVKDATIKVGDAKSKTNFQLTKGCFNGLDENAKIEISRSAWEGKSEKEIEKLEKSWIKYIQKYGFKGTITFVD
jgi:hypothetical protein